MKVKVRWTVEAFEVYEAEIEIPDEEFAGEADAGDIRDYLDDHIEDVLPGEETKDNEQSSTVEDRYVDDVTILN